jgi:hypothetical protein
LNPFSYQEKGTGDEFRNQQAGLAYIQEKLCPKRSKNSMPTAPK